MSFSTADFSRKLSPRGSQQPDPTPLHWSTTLCSSTLLLGNCFTQTPASIRTGGRTFQSWISSAAGKITSMTNPFRKWWWKASIEWNQLRFLSSNAKIQKYLLSAVTMRSTWSWQSWRRFLTWWELLWDCTTSPKAEIVSTWSLKRKWRKPDAKRLLLWNSYREETSRWLWAPLKRLFPSFLQGRSTRKGTMRRYRPSWTVACANSNWRTLKKLSIWANWSLRVPNMAMTHRSWGWKDQAMQRYRGNCPRNQKRRGRMLSWARTEQSWTNAGTAKRYHW